MERTIDMTSGNPVRQILNLAFPLILTNIGQQFYMIADAAIVGRGVGVKALAAVGSADWIYWLILWTIMGFTQGCSVYISRYFGDKNYSEMNKTIAMSTLLCGVVGCILTVAGIISARPLLLVLETPEDIISSSAIYLITLISGTLIVTAYNFSAAILRAFGDGKTPLVAMIIAAIVNIGLDLIFVMIFKWGVFGAAFASVLAQLLSFVYCFVQIRKISCVKLKTDMWLPAWYMIKKLVALSFPIALQYIIIAVGGIILQSTINMQGSIFVAGYTAVNKLYGLLESTAISLGIAFSTFFAQNFGAGNIERAKSGVKVAIALSVVASVIITLVVFVAGKSMLLLFLDVSEDGGMQALDIAWRYLYIMAVFLVGLYLIHVYRNILQSMGVSVWSMLSGLAEFFARVFLGKVVITWIGVDTLFYIEPAAWFAAAFAVMIPYYVFRNKYFERKN